MNDNANARTYFFSKDEVKSKYLQALSPMRRELLLLKMKIRRGQLEDLLSTENLSEKRRNMALRLLWFLTGALDHNLSFRSL